MKASSTSFTPRFSISPAGVSVTSTLPACISAMRSQRSASFMKCVEMKMVTPSLRDRSIKVCQKASRAIGSTPEVGSSRISTAGACTIATASERRWRWPRGNAPGSASMIVVNWNRSATSLTRVAILASGNRNSRACSSRFCRTVSSE